MLQTPYYIIQENVMKELLYSLRNALTKYWNNYIIGYSYKTNSLPWIIKYYNLEGCYAEVVSEDEYTLGQKIGVSDSKFIYNGPIKTRSSFLKALNDGSIVNIDSKREIEWLKDLDKEKCYKLGVRVNFDIEKLCPGQSACGKAGGRFGFCYENNELKNAIMQIKNKGLEIQGLHLHVSSKTRSIDIYEAIAAMACKISEEYSLNFSFIDIGGGFFGGLEDKPQFEDYVRQVTNVLSKYFSPKRTTLILEPGMSLVGAAFSYVTSVIDVKDTIYGRFVITDGSRTNIDPLMRKAKYFYRTEHMSSRLKRIKKQVIVGFTCMEDDRLMEVQNEQELAIGDRIIYDKVGAYTMCLTPLFIKYFPSVYVENGEQLKKVRERWTAEEFLKGNKWIQ